MKKIVPKQYITRKKTWMGKRFTSGLNKSNFGVEKSIETIQKYTRHSQKPLDYKRKALQQLFERFGGGL